MKKKSLLFYLVFALCANINTANAQVNVQDSLALVDLYNSTGGPNWSIHTNWLTKNPVSTWFGIGITNGRVRTISIGANNLKGSIPSSIGNLSNLQILDLDLNELRASIPSSIGNLVNLQGLYLYNNYLSGSIPFSIGNLVNLQGLYLFNNNLKGTIPSSIGNLINLSALSLRVNKFSGSIPSSIGNLAKLTVLELEVNQLSGSIPSSIGNLVSLQYLALGENQLSGSIPASIGKLVNLYYLELSNNRLSGSIPSSLSNLNGINHLEEGILNLSHNQFTFDGMELIAQTFPYDGDCDCYHAVFDHQKNIPIHQNGNTLSVYAGGTLSNNTYKWFKCDGSGTAPILLAKIKGDAVFHPSESGKYRVVVSNSVATQLKLFTKLYDYAVPTNTVIASANKTLPQDDKTNLFLVYPNPARDELHVTATGKEDISLINQSGKILLSQTINGNGTINVTSLSAGLYYLKNNTSGEVQKVIISR